MCVILVSYSLLESYQVYNIIEFICCYRALYANHLLLSFSIHKNTKQTKSACLGILFSLFLLFFVTQSTIIKNKICKLVFIAVE